MNKAKVIEIIAESMIPDFGTLNKDVISVILSKLDYTELVLNIHDCNLSDTIKNKIFNDFLDKIHLDIHPFKNDDIQYNSKPIFSKLTDESHQHFEDIIWLN